MDAVSCLALNKPKDGTTSYTKAVFSAYLELNCPGADFSKLDGKPFGDVENIDPEQYGCNSNSSDFFHIVIDVDASSTHGSETGTYSTKSILAKIKDDGSPCTTTKSGSTQTLDSGCKMIDKIVYSNVTLNGKPVSTPPRYSVYTSNGVVNQKP